jgi:hypothetical protein
MNKIVARTVIASLVLTAIAATPAPAAASPLKSISNVESQGFDIVKVKNFNQFDKFNNKYTKPKPHGPYPHKPHHHGHKHGYGKHGWGYGAAGAAGLVAGALIASSLAQQPQVVYASPPAYSGEWYAYCAQRYRSFDAATGTYMGLDGIRRVCR